MNVKLKLIVKLKVHFLLCSTHKTVKFSMVGCIRIRDSGVSSQAQSVVVRERKQ